MVFHLGILQILIAYLYFYYIQISKYIHYLMFSKHLLNILSVSDVPYTHRGKILFLTSPIMAMFFPAYLVSDS